METISISFPEALTADSNSLKKCKNIPTISLPKIENNYDNNSNKKTKRS